MRKKRAPGHRPISGSKRLHCYGPHTPSTKHSQTRSHGRCRRTSLVTFAAHCVQAAVCAERNGLFDSAWKFGRCHPRRPVYYWPDLLPTFIASRLTRTPFIVRTTMAGSLDYLLVRTTQLAQNGSSALFSRPACGGAFCQRGQHHDAICADSSPTHSSWDSIMRLWCTTASIPSGFKPVSAEKRQQLRSKLNLPVDKTIVITTSRYVAAKI